MTWGCFGPPTRAEEAGRATGLHVHHARLDENEVESLHREGVAVRVYRVNRRADMLRMIGLGVDGIITDFPDVLKRTLAEISRQEGLEA